MLFGREREAYGPYRLNRNCSGGNHLFCQLAGTVTRAWKPAIPQAAQPFHPTITHTPSLPGLLFEVVEHLPLGIFPVNPRLSLADQLGVDIENTDVHLPVEAAVGEPNDFHSSKGGLLGKSGWGNGTSWPMQWNMAVSNPREERHGRTDHGLDAVQPRDVPPSSDDGHFC